MPQQSKNVQRKKYEVTECTSFNPPYQKRHVWISVKNTVAPGEVGWTGYAIPEAGNAGKFPIGTIFTVEIQYPKKSST
jgi:hypothetical protein